MNSPGMNFFHEIGKKSHGGSNSTIGRVGIHGSIHQRNSGIEPLAFGQNRGMEYASHHTDGNERRGHNDSDNDAVCG